MATDPYRFCRPDGPGLLPRSCRRTKQLARSDTHANNHNISCNALYEIFARWGTFKTIVSDNGSKFTSSAFKDFCLRKGVQHIPTATYDPQSNGRAERFVDTLKRSLKKLEGEGDVVEILQIFLAAYRGTPCPARNGKSPFELPTTGSQMPSKLDLLRKEIRAFHPPNQQMQEQFDRHHGARLHSFVVNDPVYVKIHRINAWTWQAGTILEQRGAASYVVHVNGRVMFAHTNQLKRRFTQDLPTILIPDDNDYDIFIPPSHRRKPFRQQL